MGKEKIEVGVSGSWITISYVFETQAEVTEVFKQTFSYKYTFYIRPATPGEGGSPEAQRGWENYTAAIAVATGVTLVAIIGVAVGASISAAAAITATAAAVILVVNSFFTKIGSVLA